jgi:hypothetical protein
LLFLTACNLYSFAAFIECFLNGAMALAWVHVYKDKKVKKKKK